jgi:hypothetical protein
MACDHCERDYGPADGPRAIRSYAQSISEVAGILAAVGSGLPLRVASRDVRHTARRFTLGTFPVHKTTVRRRRDYSSRQNILAARYLDAYGPAVLARVLPTHWPRLLILDSKPLEMRPYGAVDRGSWASNLAGGALLAAAGRDDGDDIARTWRISFAGDETANSWSRFFDELAGEPEWVVMDRATALTAAVATRWPKATIFYCDWHLEKNLIQAATRDGAYFDQSPFKPAINASFYSSNEWDTLSVLAVGKPNIQKWMVDNEPLVRHQIELRTAFPDRPHSNAAAEAAIATVYGFIRKRRYNFRNVRRLNTMLGLMTANIRESGDLLTYSNIVRELALAPPDLNAGMDHGALVNDKSATVYGSIAEMILSAAGIKRTDKRTADVSAKVRSVQATADGFNAERAKTGLPLIEVRVRAGGTASVSVKGKMLTDFPEFVAEWDTAKNGHGPSGITAGHYVTESWWICASGHSWQARVGDRITRLTRCQRCVTRRADESNSLAAVHPRLLPSWDEAANLPLDPRSIRATYHKIIVWRCLAGLGHPAYRASIKKRLKDPVPCPLCRKMEVAVDLDDLF